jgi:hypothetical protein
MPYYNQSRIGGAMDSTHIYYNISISNNNSGVDVSSNGSIVEISTANKSVPIEFNQTRAQPYLENPSEYFLSVQRFTIESPNLPVFIFQPVVGQNNPNLSIYTITFNENGNITSVPILWQPQDQNIPVPAGPITQADISNPYYYCYSYAWFCKCINDSITLQYPIPPGVSSNPFMTFDTATNLFTFQGPVNTYRTAPDGTLLGITLPTAVYMNVELYNLLSSIPAIYVANTVYTACDYQIVFSTGTSIPGNTGQPYVLNVVENPVTSVNDVYSTQEYATLTLFTPVKSILFRASLLNVVSENIATPVIYQNGNININAGSQNAEILPILIEYSVPLVTGTEYKPFIFYEPKGEYRLSDLYSDVPVDGLQFSVFWKDSFGNINPFYLAIGASATVKLLFRKKSFNSDKI